jgi:hypothetical protein
MSEDQQERIAYCAPGRKPIAELVVLMQNERVASVTEHPWLEGTTDVYVFTPQPFTPAEMLPFRMQPLRAGSQASSPARDRPSPSVSYPAPTSTISRAEVCSVRTLRRGLQFPLAPRAARVPGSDGAVVGGDEAPEARNP